MSKRAPYTYGIDQSGKKYWRSLGELSETPEFNDALAREFPDGASELIDPVSRRSFLSLMGASLGLAGAAACRRPEEKIYPYGRRPEDVIPGKSNYFATAMSFLGTSIGLLVESHEGRPTKIEGNPRHPESMGAAHLYAQASILEMYDPDRASSPMAKENGIESKKSWAEATEMLKKLGEQFSATQGAGLAIITQAHRSPTLSTVLKVVATQMPQAKIIRHDAQPTTNEAIALKQLFGQSVAAVSDFAGAKVIVSLDADIFQTENSTVKLARQFAEGRRVNAAGDEMNRLYVAESRFSVTGTTADHRLRIASSQIGSLAIALAKAVGISVDGPALKDEKAQKWAAAVAKDLLATKGHCAIVAGVKQPPAVHALVAAINQTLENVGKSVKYVPVFDEAGEDVASFVEFSKQLGSIQTAVILGGNPAFSAPSDAKFAEALSKVKTVIHLTHESNETSALAHWTLNQAHALESWSDVRALDGTASIVQPLIAPLYDGKTDAEVIGMILGKAVKAYEIVRATWSTQEAVSFDKSFRKSLHEGLIEGSKFAEIAVAWNADALAPLVATYKPAADGIELTFTPDTHAWDGRFANNGWLQEMPDPLTKESWGNSALVPASLAAQLSANDGDLIQIAAGGQTITIPLVVAPGQAENTIALTYGQGRTVGGNAAKDNGYNTYPLRTSANYFLVTGATVSKASGTVEIARSQEHHTMEGRPVVREANLVQFNKRPGFAKEMVKVEKFNIFGQAPSTSDKKDTIWDTPQYNGLKWGMTIDLTTCIGCNACMVACQSENNIPLVGKDGVLRGREMHWIRVDRYFEGDDAADPKAVMQPVGCQHCENAPCELVCPVNATVHSADGTNDIAYNRCVGTRYCSNNCPYKVRRFNFFNYNKDTPELRKMHFNPNVTVRARGVMEKCSYCIQRVQEAKINAKREHRVEVRANGETVAPVKDGEVMSACQQTCPTQAITFGDLNDKNSKVAALAASPRAYGLLAEINTRPRTSFLARIRNPNPDLEQA